MKKSDASYVHILETVQAMGEAFKRMSDPDYLHYSKGKGLADTFHRRTETFRNMYKVIRDATNDDQVRAAIRVLMKQAIIGYEYDVLYRLHEAMNDES